MPAERARDGALRRAIIAVHHRMELERDARKAGLRISKWRDGKPVVRIAAGKRT